jgi:hypothetical protein
VNLSCTWTVFLKWNIWSIIYYLDILLYSVTLLYILKLKYDGFSTLKWHWNFNSVPTLKLQRCINVEISTLFKLSNPNINPTLFQRWSLTTNQRWNNVDVPAGIYSAYFKRNADHVNYENMKVFVNLFKKTVTNCALQKLFANIEKK